MKLSLLIVLLALTQVSAKVKSQNVTVDLRLQNVTVEQVINRLEKQLKRNFFFNREKTDVNRKVDVDFKGATLDEIVRRLFGENFKYRLVDNLIVISVKKEGTEQQPEGLVVEGNVKDKNGEPLPGVTILIKGTQVGGVTDQNGKFKLTVPTLKETVLIFSFVGMQKKEVAYKGKVMNVILEEENNEMEEVVVTGIFTKARESYTGAATTITAKELHQAGNRSILTSIRNIDPSFNIADDISIGSDPNQLPDITIRGKASLTKDIQEDSRNNPNLPLFIMDGFEITLTRVMDLDDNQVENITLLKDASATALYGARGANGVVVITTKKPEAGRLRMTYKVDANIEAPDLTSYNLLNAREKLQFEVAADLYKGKQELQDLYNQRLLDVERGVNTYWLKYPVRTGIGHRHSLRIEGGDQALRYAVAVGYNSIIGTMKGSERNTLNANAFLSYAYKKLTFQNDLQIATNRAKNSPYGTFYNFAKINSYWTPYDDEGKIKRVLEDYTYFNEYMLQSNYVENPLYNSQLKSFNKSQYTQVQDNFAFDWKIFPSLVFRGRFTLSSNITRSDVFTSPKNTKYDKLDIEQKGEYSYGSGQSFRYDVNFSVNYNKVFRDKHSLYVGLNYNFAQDKMENYSFSAEGFQNEKISFLGMAGQYTKNGKPSGTESITRRTGGILNVNYTYDRRYFVDGSIKFDASSRFGANNRIAPFWSVGAGWNIHNEVFLQEHPIISLLRLRISYGISGSQSFSPYQAIKTFKYLSKNYRGFNGAYIMAMGNEDLGWQQTGQINVGINMEMFHGKIRINADIYRKLTDNLLSDITLPTTSGFDSYKANVGKVKNQGVELGFNFYPVRNTAKEIVWSIGGSLAHNKNTIMEISNTLKALNDKLQASVGPSFMYKEGQSMNTIFVVKSLGIDPSNGEEILLTAGGKKTYNWNSRDKVPCGVAEPKIWGNLSTMLRYKGFTLNMIFGYRAGGQIYNSTLVNNVENVRPYDNADKRVFYDRWKQPGDHAFFKSVKNRQNTYASSRFVMDERTLECRSLNVQYEWASPWLKRMSLDYLTFAMHTEDVFRLSTIKQERGTSYPFARKFSFSLTVRF